VRAGLTFALLGPVRAWRDGTELALGTPQQRALLALLLLYEGRAASVSEIADAVWGEKVPTTAVSTIRTYLHRLRRVLGPADDDPVIVLENAGYALKVDQSTVDVGQFRRTVALADSARLEHAREQEGNLLRTALALYQGVPLAGISGSFVGNQRTRLEQLRITTFERLFGLELERGRHAELIDQLQAVVAAEPLREPLRELLILSLYRSGRQAEALVAYEDVRRVLRDELGTEPGSQLRELHQRVLRSDPDLLPAHDDFSVQVSGPAKPAQLPADLPLFVGRAALLTSVVDSLSGDGTASNGKRVTLVRGMAGIGKTAFALHLAHRVAEHFPDGQLYVNLRGFDGANAAVGPQEAVRGFLHALGVPPAQIPAEADAQSALYRSVVAGRKLLILVDNASESAQVLPLLPGSSQALTVVTSRNQLDGLITATGARSLVLGLLSEEEAKELLIDRLGAARVEAEPEATAEIIDRCARLPLALAVVCARISAQPDEFPLAEIAAELFDTHATLDAFVGADVDIRAVLSSSYSALSPPAARLFRLLALHPGSEMTVNAAASLAAEPVRPARVLVREIVNAHLVVETSPGRFVWHDLLRAYATEHLTRSETAEQRNEAFHRLADHYLHTAERAASLVSAQGDGISPLEPVDGVTTSEVRGKEDATRWFKAERLAALPVLNRMLENRLHEQAWRFAWSLRHFHDRQGWWHDLAAAQRIAVRAAAYLPDRTGLAFAYRGLARAETRLHRYEMAREHLDLALAIFTETRNTAAMGYTLRQYSYLSELCGDIDSAQLQSRRARDLFREIGLVVGEAAASNALGWYYLRLGEHDEAIAHCDEALRLYEKSDDEFGKADVFDSLGYIYYCLDRYEESAENYHRSLEIYRSFDAYEEEAETLNLVSETYRALGKGFEADEAGRRATLIQDSRMRRMADASIAPRSY
jgi:DNA-binding SARP family transcriptional activator/tetratricopeptide (TPR) repeat protein